MSNADAVNLTHAKIYQGTLISCSDSSISKEIKEVIQDGRALSGARNKPVSDAHMLLVLSQDCDISNVSDHCIEVIAIKKVPKGKTKEPQQKNRNYRKLQLPHNDEFWLCEADLISVINKSCLTGNIEIIGDLNDYSKGIIIDWRVGRYNRIPFPDKFNRLFITECIKNSENNFEDFLESYRDEIIDLYVFVDPANEEQADKYAVSITALLSEECSTQDESIIEKYIQNQCQQLHDSELPLNMMQIDSSVGPDNLSIPQDYVLRMSDFSFLDAAVLRRITLDYLCYHDEE